MDLNEGGQLREYAQKIIKNAEDMLSNLVRENIKLRANIE
jgi:hypothetical protein